MKVLLHICCGPCMIYPLKVLRAEGHSVTGYFYNPNIHPFTEFKKRMESMEEYADKQGLRVASEVGYDMEEFLRRTIDHLGERHGICYEMRLRKTAQAALDSGFEAFTTTLLYSKYQNHEEITQISNVVAKDIGVKFLYKDFRDGWDEGQKESRDLGLYRQKYCGCIYSEKERFMKPEKEKEKVKVKDKAPAG